MIQQKTGIPTPGQSAMDGLSANAVRAGLTMPDGWAELLFFPSLPSTNTLAKEMAEAGAPHGTVLLADEQTAGRGRLGRSFFSPAGSGIYISMLLRPDLPLSSAVHVTAAAAVAVCRAISRVTGLEPQIKWVNDIYLGGRKLCGILTEASVLPGTDRLQYAVVGIGINVTAAAYPAELRETVTALSEHAVPPDRAALVSALLDAFGSLLPDLSTAGFLSEYKARSCLLGRPILVLRGEAGLPAVARDITPDGSLLVEWPDGSRETLCSGEVSVRPVKKTEKTVEVAAALIWEGDRFLICQRPPQKARGLLWEFVGGKLEPGETGPEALVRECREELNVQLAVQDVYLDVVHEYPDLTVHLTLYRAAIAEGTPTLLEHNAMQWILPEEIPNYAFCPADVEILWRIAAGER